MTNTLDSSDYLCIRCRIRNDSWSPIIITGVAIYGKVSCGYINIRQSWAYWIDITHGSMARGLLGILSIVRVCSISFQKNFSAARNDTVA